MREEMSRAPAFLRAQFTSTTKAPVLAMTATAQTGSEDNKAGNQ